MEDESGRSQGKVAAVTVALVLGAIIAAAVVVGVVTYVRHQSHLDACQRIRGAFPVVLVVPQPGIAVDQGALEALPASDRKVLVSSIAAFRRQVSKELATDAPCGSVVASSGVDANGCPPTLGDSDVTPATAASVTASDAPQWKAFAAKFERGVLVEQGC
jgi:hypothetical protein